MKAGSGGVPVGPASMAVPVMLALRAPWQWRGNTGGRWTPWLAAVAECVWLVGTSTALMVWVPRPQAWVLLALVWSASLLGAWGRHLLALLRLDHPHAARLVPGHSRALRRAALGLWLALVLLAAGAGAGAAIGLRGDAELALRWMQWAALGAGAAALYVALALQWWPLWVLLWLGPTVFAFLGSPLRQLIGAVWAHGLAAPWLYTPLALLAMGVALVSSFGRGDAAHARRHAARERLRRIWEDGSAGQKPTLDAWGRWGAWLATPWNRLQQAWLARVLAHATPDRASVMDRAEVALHGPQHWVRQVGVLMPLLLVTGVALAVLAIRGGGELPVFLRHAAVGMGIGLVSMLLGPLASLPGTLWVSRREQALLMLLPGMPQGAALNRALAWRHARAFLLLWVLTLPLFVGLAWAAEAAYVMAFPGVALPMVAWLWRDASRQPAPRTLTAVAPYGVCLVLALASLVLMREQPGAWLPWLAGLLAVSAPLLVWRWRRLSRLPQALPAGRHA